MLVKLIVFIHGTLCFLPSWESFKAVLYPTHYLQSYYQSHHCNLYQRYKTALRFHSILKYQPIDLPGLRKIVCNQSGSDFPSLACSHVSTCFEKIDRDLHSAVSDVRYIFYTYGWNGKLNEYERREAAEKLYHPLIQEVVYQKQMLTPDDHLELIIVAHSHGGNVALNLAAVEDGYQFGLTVDHLILLGTPVQCETEALIYASLFKNIYNLYSASDWTQRADIFSSKDLYAQRKFKHHKNSTSLPKKLKQIQVKVDNKNPDHAELWMFGAEKNFLYRRKKLSISPFPVAAFIPLIIGCNWANISRGCVNLCKQENNYRCYFYPHAT